MINNVRDSIWMKYENLSNIQTETFSIWLRLYVFGIRFKGT